MKITQDVESSQEEIRVSENALHVGNSQGKIHIMWRTVGIYWRQSGRYWGKSGKIYNMLETVKENI